MVSASAVPMAAESEAIGRDALMNAPLSSDHIKQMLGPYGGFCWAQCKRTGVGFLISPELAASGQYQADGYDVRPATLAEINAQSEYDKGVVRDLQHWGTAE